MKAKDIAEVRAAAAALLRRARIAVTRGELESMEVADLGLGDIRRVGLEVIVYENNDRYCAKELVLLPRQLCPEHRHPRVNGRNPGKKETFRCRHGEIYFYVAGERTPRPKARVPRTYKPFLTVWREIVLRPGDQYTLPPDSLHWFQAGDKGAVVSEFSSTSTDQSDVFSDPRVRRVASS
ncbi:MAG TPA: D-lyxose/D-mannose family sugar isomerase [Candidatus Aminicenantes bacterium]|nr:D-lyxose/D-mannose family sugar isomerase [Candidatus Aminicenantes bacterium]HRY64599.1 D-lyxose/D-mannose family sugar isomerase [Candidatus Aminicenantes bacterium]HRZ71512.1 D-lyxose/D-mannose family sugar isomerase [Candidatus Aminicenantes bacterium]